MKIIGIAFLCVLIFLGFVVWLGGEFSARNESPKQPDQAHQITDAPKKYLTSLNTALTLGFNRLGTFIHDFREEIVAIGTLFIAGLTVILAFATAFLYGATRDLVKGAEETAERQLRAYVFIQGGQIQIVDNGTAVGVGVTLKNFGQTPGYDFETWTLIEIGDPNQPPFAKTSPPMQKSIIGPSADFNAPAKAVPLTAQDRAAINAGTKVIFVWGRASYTDAFKRQWTFIFEDTNGGPKESNLVYQGQVVGVGWGLKPMRYAEESTPS
jgi:hypothetical protein